jgi:biotin carboxylase
VNLVGKRLLFLGGPIQVLKAVEQAKKMGVYTIVTDIKENALAKSLADEALPYSVTDVESILAWCRKNPVDGVLNFGVDPAQKPNVEICEALGLPHFGTLEQVEFLSNKQAFKDLCRECGVDVIQSYTEEDISDDFTAYPLMIKPAQNCGSRGSRVCHNKEEAEQAILNARKSSLNGKIVIERYMQGCQDFSVEYYAVDGKLFLVRTQDRYIGSSAYHLERQAVGGVSPSKHTDLYLKNVHPRVVRMLERIGIANGALFMQGFVDGDTVRFYDPAYRFPGSAYEKLLYSATGVNLMEYAVSFALGAKKEAVPELNGSYRLNGKCSIMLLFTARPGVIASCSGMEEIKQMPEVVSAVLKEAVGSEIRGSGDVGQRIAEVGLLVDDDKKIIEETVLNVQSKLKVLDENGDSLLVSLVDPRLFR